eukprot:CAMPEP_0114676072 /NCGR_PEP_ID=MMETSP0191-20121206/48750_1 /TAXON_ID=126664 /ORGANISM="Sorites sp." /LENGTH=176 /DNA_ID=CAMNT_0001946465 /DNA_START=48 /DNA_END=578 /DNA_ORIENTATION=+
MQRQVQVSVPPNWKRFLLMVPVLLVMELVWYGIMAMIADFVSGCRFVLRTLILASSGAVAVCWRGCDPVGLGDLRFLRQFLHLRLLPGYRFGLLSKLSSCVVDTSRGRDLGSRFGFRHLPRDTHALGTMLWLEEDGHIVASQCPLTTSRTQPMLRRRIVRHAESLVAIALVKSKAK